MIRHAANSEWGIDNDAFDEQFRCNDSENVPQDEPNGLPTPNVARLGARYYSNRMAAGRSSFRGLGVGILARWMATGFWGLEGDQTLAYVERNSRIHRLGDMVQETQGFYRPSGGADACRA